MVIRGMIYAGKSCIPSICRRDLPIILLFCIPSKEHDSSGHYYRFPAPHRRSSDAIDCNLLRPPSPLSHSVSLMHAQNPAEMDGVFSIQMSCVRDMNKLIRKNDRNTSFLQQVYNNPLTWVGSTVCGTHPM
jgi:hypothetical protein